jgi:hypothetical protein
MIHLGTTRMNTVPRGMHLIHSLLLQGFFLRHNQPILEPQCAFYIFEESSDLWVTISHFSFDMPRAIIALLCSNDLNRQGRCEGNVEQ